MNIVETIIAVAANQLLEGYSSDGGPAPAYIEAAADVVDAFDSVEGA